MCVLYEGHRFLYEWHRLFIVEMLSWEQNRGITRDITRRAKRLTISLIAVMGSVMLDGMVSDL